jgi:integrase/recombinase XerC
MASVRNQPDSSAGHFAADLQHFYRFLQSEKQFSPHTLKAYQRDISRLMIFIEAQQITAWGLLDEQHIRQFISQLHRQGMGGKSIQRLLSSLRRLFRYLQTSHLISSNPASHVRAPKSERRLPEVMHPQQIQQLLHTRSEQPLELRDHAILELLYAGGLRLSELISLNLEDIDWASRQLQVLGKGRKQRHCPFGRAADTALKKWLKCRDNLVKGDEKSLFVSKSGNRLSASSIRARIHKLCREKGIEQRVYPHLMRHSFASHMLEASQDLRAVQELLGHAHLKTTQIYTHLDFQQLARTYDAAHPRALKGRSRSSKIAADNKAKPPRQVNKS